jgi:hypothetical protein
MILNEITFCGWIFELIFIREQRGAVAGVGRTVACEDRKCPKSVSNGWMGQESYEYGYTFGDTDQWAGDR